MGLLAVEYLDLLNSWMYITVFICGLSALIIRKNILKNISMHWSVLLGTWPLLFVLLTINSDRSEYVYKKIFDLACSVALAYALVLVRGSYILIASLLGVLTFSITEFIQKRIELDNSLSLQSPTRSINFADFRFYGRDSTRVVLTPAGNPKIVCVTFSSTGCLPCIRLKPHWRELELKNRAYPEVQFLNVFSDGSKDGWRHFKRHLPLLPEDMTVVYDDSARLVRALRVGAFPATFIFDAQGNQVLRYDGFAPSDAFHFEQFFQVRLDSLRARAVTPPAVSVR